MDRPIVKITKMESEPSPSKTPVKPISDPKLDGGKKKTYPRGILKTSKIKIKPVADPAKHPPLKKFMKKHTIRLLTDSGANHRRKTIKQKIDKMSDKKVKDLVIKAGLSKGSGPSGLLRQILEGGMLSGFVSSG
uniref:Uncharacterized protein n=1 Tax=viral metagenome TaxID=1070528 RepID=A0A6C0EQC6_9ZZZZ